MPFIWIDEERRVFVNTKDFIEQINSCEEIPRYIRSDNPFDMLLNLVVGMLHGKEMVLLDSDFSINEIAALGINIDELNSKIRVGKNPVFADIQEITSCIKNQTWKLWMFTSGTTGLPKTVCHSYKTLGRNIRFGARYVQHIWAFAYRFSHMAGIQVMLQALLNANPMIYVFESNPAVVVKQLKKYHCTHISATPTFYRNIIPFIVEELTDLTDLTMGGEKYDADICTKIQQLLPNVRLHNIYAATETGSILNAKDSHFEIPDKYRDKIKISENGELLIHRSLLGEFSVEGEWYNTHDLVKESEGKITFVSRQSDLINVGGYKVNPLEVEEAVLEVPGVLDCIVKGKANSVLGSILTAEIIKEEDIDSQVLKRDIQKFLKDRMQPFKIPRIITFVETIEHTRSGKKVRK